MVSLKYALTKEDYMNYYTYIMWDSPGNKRKRLMYYVRQILPILLFLAAFYYTGLLQRQSNFILLIVGFLFLTTLLSVMGIRSNTMRQAEKIASEPDNDPIFLETQLTASEKGLQLSDSVSETHYQWKAVIRKLESRNYYFLFVNALQAIIIPKRVFHSADERLQFDRLLSQYLSFDAEVQHLVKN